MRTAQKCAGGAKFIGAAQAFGRVFGDAGLADGFGVAALALGLGGEVACQAIHCLADDLSGGSMFASRR